ncbi:hypothetical protein FRACA_1420002 [Frankia canadensis]|uniref:Uncharacterized protein n=1 Tax=Frankia canadensis TaxID=1836972 RepID=A0A2I2KLF3_9ACTN|nr:hypothetical protein FRACA_1420002 [Frankia canadensis]SOU53791.1 hypothetical protein FRACA_1420002 [Frankia canadensis]
MGEPRPSPGPAALAGKLCGGSGPRSGPLRRCARGGAIGVGTPTGPAGRCNLFTQVRGYLLSVMDYVHQHPNRSILAAGPDIAIRQVATRALTRDDVQ